MAQLQNPTTITVVAAQTTAWTRLFDADFGAKVCRFMLQNRGNGNVYLSPVNRGGGDLTGGILIPAPAPVAGGATPPATWIDEPTGACVDNNHRGEWWFVADTVGLVFTWAVWL